MPVILPSTQAFPQSTTFSAYALLRSDSDWLFGTREKCLAAGDVWIRVDLVLLLKHDTNTDATFIQARRPDTVNDWM